MRPVFGLAFAAAVTLALQPALAQAPESAVPPGVQNPARAQPPLIATAPVPLVPPAPQLKEPTPDAPAAGFPLNPGGAGGLCECLVSHNLSASAFDKTKMHQTCLASAEACQAACNTQYLFSYVPHSTFTCPGRPEETGHVAMNTSRTVRLLSAR